MKAGWLRGPSKKGALPPEVRELPGVHWTGTFWAIPENAVGLTNLQLNTGNVLEDEPIIPVNPTLYEYQQAAVKACLQGRRRFLNFEMGLGKTPTALEALRLDRGGATLIVCPAIVRQVWLDEMCRWFHDNWLHTNIISTGQEAAYIEPQQSTYIISYALLPKLDSRWSPVNVIFDECHMLKNPRSARYKAARKVLQRQAKGGLRLFLTGTPVDNEPIDLWAQGDLMVKGSFGTFSQFRARYCNERPNAYSASGKEWYGLNQSKAPELRRRFGSVSERVTKSEVSSLLPPLTVCTVRVRPEKLDIRELLERFAQRPAEAPSGILRALADQKLKHAVDLVRQVIDGGAGHVAVLCHLKSTARALAKALDGECITGDVAIPQRHQILSGSPPVLVATMHSLSTGLSLNDYTEVVYAELDWRPSEVAQSMARYHRVSGNAPVRVQLLVLEGTLEERIASELVRKLSDASAIIEAGKVDGELTTSLDEDEDEETFLAGLREAAESMLDDDPYL